MAKNILAQITESAEQICEKNNVYLYDIEYQKEGKNQVLRIYIDKDEGVDIDCCETVSRALSDLLDEQNLIQTAYHLEVSSPGVERKLTKQWHFEKVIGKKIELSLYAPIDGQKSFQGILEQLKEKTVYLNCDGQSRLFELSGIASAKLYFDINEVLKSK